MRFLNPRPADYILAVKRVSNTNTVKPAAERKIQKSTSELDAMHDYDQYLTAGAEKKTHPNISFHKHTHARTRTPQNGAQSVIMARENATSPAAY